MRNEEVRHSFFTFFRFHRPILIARSEITGGVLVFMADPDFCTLIAGQYHEVDTAKELRS